MHVLLFAAISVTFGDIEGQIQDDALVFIYFYLWDKVKRLSSENSTDAHSAICQF
jgi:hypothetical protein